MSEHAAPAHAALVQRAADGQQLGIGGADAGTMAVGVDLDPDIEGLAVGLTEIDQRLRRGQVVGDQDELAAPPSHRQGLLLHAVRRDAGWCCRVEEFADYEKRNSVRVQ